MRARRSARSRAGSPCDTSPSAAAACSSPSRSRRRGGRAACRIRAASNRRQSPRRAARKLLASACGACPTACRPARRTAPCNTASLRRAQSRRSRGGSRARARSPRAALSPGPARRSTTPSSAGTRRGPRPNVSQRRCRTNTRVGSRTRTPPGTRSGRRPPRPPAVRPYRASRRPRRPPAPPGPRRLSRRKFRRVLEPTSTRLVTRAASRSWISPPVGRKPIGVD